MSTYQQGDVRIFQTDDGGEVSVVGGIMEMDGGLETTAYLSLFGGNEDDAGGSDVRLTWWANLDEAETARQYRSETQYLLQALPATSANLRRIEDAAVRDLEWMVSGGVASSVSVAVSIPQLNRVQIVVTIRVEGLSSEFVFVENWKASV